MILETLIHQQYDRLDYDIDCTPMFNGDPGDSVILVNANVTGADAALSVVTQILDASTVKVWIFDGTPGVQYKVEVNVDSQNGRSKQDELLVVVEDF